jgi:hypothetical protein
MKRLMRLVPGIVVALALTTAAFAATTDGKSAGTALPLTGTLSGSLKGSLAGTFAYYTFDYPGDGSQGTITLNLTPSGTGVANAFGVSLWQNGTRIGNASGVGSTPGSNNLFFTSSVAGPILTQVYNYNDGVTVDYTITLSGVSQATAPSTQASAAATPTPTPGSSSGPIALTTPASGTLPGNEDGSFVYYTYNTPGDGSTQSVTLDYSPKGNDVGNAVFLSLFENGQPIATGQGSQSQTLGHLVVSYASTTPGPVLVQIGNYNMATTIDYTLSH